MTRQADHRLRLIGFVFAFAFAVVIARACYIQLFEAQALAARAHGQQSSTSVIDTTRGQILDAGGNVMALTVPSKDLWAYPAQVDQLIYRERRCLFGLPKKHLWCS